MILIVHRNLLQTSHPPSFSLTSLLRLSFNKMPASAGRVRMPHNNRVAAAAALKTTAIWQKTIGYETRCHLFRPDLTGGFAHILLLSTIVA
jgi:hypothetical protein